MPFEQIDPQHELEQLASIQAFDPTIKIEPYVWVYGSASPVQTALSVGSLYGPGTRVWLDCEDADAPTIGWLDTCIEELEALGCTAGIYTRKGWWEDHTQDDFSDLPLWDALYDGIPNVEVFTPYGGWTQAEGKQYGGVDGIDCNVFRSTAVPPSLVPVPQSLDRLWEVAQELEDQEDQQGRARRIKQAIVEVKKVTYRDPTQP